MDSTALAPKNKGINLSDIELNPLSVSHSNNLIEIIFSHTFIWNSADNAAYRIYLRYKSEVFAIIYWAMLELFPLMEDFFAVLCYYFQLASFLELLDIIAVMNAP